MYSALMLATAMVATAISASLLALMAMALMPSRQNRSGRPTALLPGLEPTAFLFEEDDLLDATGPARRILDSIPGLGSDLSRLVGFLSARFGGLPDRLSSLDADGDFTLSSADGGTAELSVERAASGRIRLTLSERETGGQGLVVDALAYREQERELEKLRALCNDAPLPIWHADRNGAVQWANSAYLTLAAQADGVPEDELAWPLPALGGEAGRSAGRSRQRVAFARGGGTWLDCQRVEADGGLNSYGLPADALVQAESALGEFVQTLGKTFTDLPVGLAIFDRNRQLALFNPALLDLSRLGFEFLSSHPTLGAFLDRLREARVLPEPKDYVSWRQRLTAVEAAADSGEFEEVWTTATGQTLRVRGQPHPDKALAFLIEDISAETSLSRKFRAEVQLGQDIIDGLDDAVAAFDAQGALVLSNAAYDRMWGVEPGLTLGIVTIADSLKHWKMHSRATDVWDALRHDLVDTGLTAERRASAELIDGAGLACRFQPLGQGTLLATFRRTERAQRSVDHAGGHSGDQLEDAGAI